MLTAELHADLKQRGDWLHAFNESLEYKDGTKWVPCSYVYALGYDNGQLTLLEPKPKALAHAQPPRQPQQERPPSGDEITDEDFQRELDELDARPDSDWLEVFACSQQSEGR